MIRPALLCWLLTAAAAAGRTPAPTPPADERLTTVKDLNGYFPFSVPPTREAWEDRRRHLREQVLVATGLWPMPERPPLKPVVHGKIERTDYTIEKAFFPSYPGHYVSGNLYRPKGKKGPFAGVLCPDGHWKDARFADAGEDAAREQIQIGAEKTVMGARYFLQARCAQLARMGCVVFHYDMVGMSDSRQITHAEGFRDAEAELRMQSAMGLQTFNSVRALDFLLSQSDVDSKRIGMTGASGGGTQTFILAAIDDRLTAAFPAVMVSTAMQGGCVCENCSHLRVGTGNIELAGLFAPKPLGMSGANDWTIEIEKKGLPELKALYRLYGAEDKVMAKCFPQFQHNYNQVSRELMYNWFNKHLSLGQPEPVVEMPFEPVPGRWSEPRHELSVYDDRHPLPKDAAEAATLRKTITALSDKQMAALRPRDEETLKRFQHVIRTALAAMIHDQLPSSEDIEGTSAGEVVRPDSQVINYVARRRGTREAVPVRMTMPNNFNGTMVVVVHPGGRGVLEANDWAPMIGKLLERGCAVVAPDVFRTGAKSATTPLAVNETFAGYTFGYNRSLLANRVHDILTVVAEAEATKGAKAVHLIGIEKAGPWVLLARTMCGWRVRRTVVDIAGFSFEDVRKTSDEMMLPGALKYGGLPAFAARCAPGELLIHNVGPRWADGIARDAYRAAGAGDSLNVETSRIAADRVLEWVLR